jgi:outer membrane receptor protein involved in Fe transport
LEKLNVYVGVENLLNYTQKDPTLASDDPFGSYFDSSMAWGPIFGRNIYAGIRYTLK